MEPTTAIQKLNIMAAYALLIQKAAEHGFTNEIDDETHHPSNYLFFVDKWEVGRIILPADYWKHETTSRHIIIDRLSIDPFTDKRVSACKCTEFYRGTIDLADLDFFEKLLLSIFPKPVNYFNE